MAEWFVRCTTKLATQVAAGLPTGYSVLRGNLTRYCFQQFGLAWINSEVMKHTMGSVGNKFHPYQVGNYVKSDQFGTNFVTFRPLTATRPYSSSLGFDQ